MTDDLKDALDKGQVGGWSTKRKDVDEGILPYVLPYQAEIIREHLKHETAEETAEALGKKASAVRALLTRARRRAARAGYSPAEDEAGTVPPGYVLRGKSILYDEHGKPRLTWVKSAKSTKVDRQELIDAMQDVVETAERCGPNPAELRPRATTDLLALWPFGDPHIGLYTWARETGAPFDLEIAERNIRQAIDRCALLTPPVEVLKVLNLGDLTHGDNRSNTTPRGGHQLDVDSRHPKVVEVALRCMLYAAERALDCANYVDVENLIGNHDQETSWMISLMMDAYFRHEPRIRVGTEPTTHRLIADFGKVMLTASHGEYVKPPHVPLLMAEDFNEVWGRTKHRYHHGGHIHHIQRHELVGMVVESHRTLAPKDKHTTMHGWRSGRSMDVILYHRERGEIGRHTVGVETE